MTIRFDRITCKIAPKHREILEPWLRGDHGGIEDWEGMVPVKESTVRSVRRGQITTDGAGSVHIHLKTYRAVRLSDRARDALGGARGVREFDNLVQARARGINCVEPLAAGRETGSAGSRSFLITASADATALSESGDWPPGAAAAAGAALREAHDRGLHAQDLHPGNLLYGPDGVLLCDLTAAILANPLEEDERARGLARFCLGLDGLVLDRDAWPLLEAYDASDALIDAALRDARRLRHRALEAFGRRALRKCRHTITLTDGPNHNVAWYLHRGAEALHAAARSWDIDTPDTAATKHGRRGAVWLDGPLAVKRRSKPRAEQLQRARYWLEFAGVPAPAAVALRVHHRHGFVFAERLPWPDLKASFDSLSEDEKLATAVELGRVIGRLHGHGLRNRDLKLDNLVRDPGTGTVHVIDLDGIRRLLPLEQRGQARDLGRLLAAVREASGKAGVDHRLLSRFARSYNRSLRQLSIAPNPRLWRHTEDRATEWANAHPNTPAS